MSPIPKFINDLCTSLGNIYRTEVVYVDRDMQLNECTIGMTIERISWRGGDVDGIDIGIEGTLHTYRAVDNCPLGHVGGLIFGAFQYQEGKNTIPIEFDRQESIEVGSSTLGFRVTSHYLQYDNEDNTSIEPIEKFNVNGDLINE